MNVIRLLCPIIDHFWNVLLLYWCKHAILQNLILLPISGGWYVTTLIMYVEAACSKIFTYLLTPCSTVLLEKLTVSAVSQDIPRIFGTRRFITLLTSARQLSLSWANSIQSPQPPPTSWRSILILSSLLLLGLPNGLFPSGFPTRTLCTPLPSPILHLRTEIVLVQTITFILSWLLYSTNLSVNNSSILNNFSTLIR